MLTELPTPSFLVDIQRARANCLRMLQKARASSVAFRPHVKTHKTIEGARLQHGGNFGPITVSTLAEAEFFADGGFRDITYAVPIAPDKLDRAASLAARVDRLNVLVDSEAALQAMEQRGFPFEVFLKIDCGYHRAGVNPENPDSVALARAMLRSSTIRFVGILTHAGHSYHARNADDVRRIAAEETGCLTRFRALDEELSFLVRSVGSTPTASVVDRFTEVDEVRPGNYIFYDAFQAAIGSCRVDDVAVSVLATVIGSYPERRCAIIDAGALALSKDLGADHIDPDISYGIVSDLDLEPLSVRLTSVSQEHGKLEGIAHLPVGTKVRIIPNHSCLTAAMFDRYHVIERREVVGEWKPARGW